MDSEVCLQRRGLSVGLHGGHQPSSPQHGGLSAADAKLLVCKDSMGSDANTSRRDWPARPSRGQSISRRNHFYALMSLQESQNFIDQISYGFLRFWSRKDTE